MLVSISLQTVQLLMVEQYTSTRLIKFPLIHMGSALLNTLTFLIAMMVKEEQPLYLNTIMLILQEGTLFILPHCSLAVFFVPQTICLTCHLNILFSIVSET